MQQSIERVTPQIAVVTFRRPERRNALDDAAVDELDEHLAELRSDPSCRVIILTGDGASFCAGLDLSLAAVAPEPHEGESETAAWMRRQERFTGLITRLRDLPQPVIAAVNGHAAGAGLALALACDLRLAASSASFMAPFIKIGLTSCDMGVSYLLPRCVGTSHAAEMMLTGRAVDADEALRIGLVSHTVPDDELLDRATELATVIAGHESFAVWMTKRGMWANVEASSLAVALELENRTQMLARTTGELERAAARFLAGEQGS